MGEDGEVRLGLKAPLLGLTVLRLWLAKDRWSRCPAAQRKLLRRDKLVSAFCVLFPAAIRPAATLRGVPDRLQDRRPCPLLDPRLRRPWFRLRGPDPGTPPRRNRSTGGKRTGTGPAVPPTVSCRRPRSPYPPPARDYRSTTASMCDCLPLKVVDFLRAECVDVDGGEF